MMCVCRQDPCAGGHGWIEVTGAAVSCRCCSNGAQSTLQTLVLHRGRRERQIKMGRVQRKRRDGKMEELNSKRAGKKETKRDTIRFKIFFFKVICLYRHRLQT